MGQLATLQWIEAGPRVAYQHYLPPDRLFSEAPTWSLAVVLAQLLAVGFALGTTRPRLALPEWLRGWRLVVTGGLLVLTSATLVRDPLGYAAELALASLVQVLHLATAVLLALSLSPAQSSRFGAFVDRLLGAAPAATSPPEPGGADRFAWTLAAMVALVAVTLALLSYQRHPHIPDEVTYLLQARYFGDGLLTLPAPPVRDAFDLDLMTYQATRWFSPLPPGWPAILAIGAGVGLGWLVNPLLGGISILLAYLLCRELYPRRTARLAILLLAVSPWQLFMSMNLMTHTASLAAALGAAAAVGRLRRDPRARWALIAGLGIGVVGLIRPLEGLAVALVLGPWSLAARGARFRLGPAAIVTATTILVSAIVLPYNAHLTGSPGTFPVMAYTDALYGPGTNALGFGSNRGMPWPGLDPLPGHGLPDVLINANFNLFQLNVELFGWATGSLLVLLLLIPLWRRLRPPDWGMLGVVAVVVGLHSFYYFSGGPDFGARYWYLIIAPCVILAARGLEILAGAEGQPSGPADRRPLAAATALALAGLLVFVPWRAVDKYHHYRRMRPEPRAIAADPTKADAVILVRGRRHPDFASAASYNPLDLTARTTIFAWDRGDDVRRELVRAYPDRPFWILEGPTVTGAGYAFLAGPLRGEELLARRDTVIPP